jgi:hypothetical protein
MTIRSTPEVEAIREATDVSVSPEAEAEHLELIREKVRLFNYERRIKDLEVQTFQLTEQVRILTAQMACVVGAQKAEESEYIHELRRAIVVIGLGDIMAEWGWDDTTPAEDWDWEPACERLFARYGHLTAGGRPLWTKPPKAPSEATKQLIAESLKRRQES